MIAPSTTYISTLSIMTAIFLSGILTLLLYMLRKRPSSLRYFSFSSIALVYLLCIIRMILPLDFPFSYIVRLEFFLNPVMNVMRFEIIRLGGHALSVAGLLGCIWLLVSTIQLSHFLHQYRATGKMLEKLKMQSADDLQGLLFQIERKRNHYIPIEILYCAEVSSPCSIGLLHKRILLPYDDYTEIDLHYIVLHEYTHFANHDLAVKMLLQFVKCFFWWNPMVYLLEKDIDQVLEIKCDNTVVSGLTKMETVQYMQTILSLLAAAEEKAESSVFAKPSVAFLGVKKSSNMQERFQQIQASIKVEIPKHARWRQIAFCGLAMVLFCFSYLVIFQPNYETPYNEIVTNNNMEYISPDEVVVVKHTDRSYSIITGDMEVMVSEDTANLHIESGTELIKE